MLIYTARYNQPDPECGRFYSFSPQINKYIYFIKRGRVHWYPLKDSFWDSWGKLSIDRVLYNTKNY